jgi:GNAT superfamily N-acetyltransferase
MIVEIKKYSDIKNENIKEQIIEIFLESSTVKAFSSQEAMDNFIYKYLGYYMDKYPSWILVALNGNNVLGYICGLPDSKLQQELYEKLDHYELFDDLYPEFPAHLHINLSDDARGKGIGSRLINNFSGLLKQSSIKGVHIITSPVARNVGFYKKNEFDKLIERDNKLFMGKTL